MKRRNVVIPVFLLLLVFVVFLIRRWNEPQRKEAFERHPSSIQYTKKVLCRMECGNITEAEIKEIMQKGLILYHKSDRWAKPCPTFAVQGRTKGGNYLRVHFLQCENETQVVNLYDVEKQLDCLCLGQESKGGQ